MKTIKLFATCGLLLLSAFFQNIFAQCTDDTHSTHPADNWLSCETTVSPNPNRGAGHWVLYDLGYEYTLGLVTLWNYNVEGETDRGFKDVHIDYSSDATTWTTGTTFQLPEATGMSDYAGYEGADLNEVSARYILIFAETTWGTSGCAGLAEFKMEVSNTTTLALTVFDFVAQAEMDYIVLNWGLSRVDNVAYFELERSTNAQDFSKIAELESYTYEDKKVEEGRLYYYRLKIWDEQGTWRYSPIRKAKVQKTVEISIFPNPVKNTLTMDWTTTDMEELILQNASGHELKRWHLSGTRLQIDVSSLPSGLYFLQIRDRKGELHSRRLVKVE